MSIFVLGADGYIGWPLSMRIAREFPDEKIILVDSQVRRYLVKDVQGQSVTPILGFEDRVQAFRQQQYGNLIPVQLSLTNPEIDSLFREYKPRIVFHLAQVGSAPYSMKGEEEACFVLNNNETGNMRVLWAVRENCPDAHIIKSGSMGQYTKCGLDIPEGYFFPEHNGKKSTHIAPFPRQAEDVYHVSKINDSNYAAMACRSFGLRITDVMQSTVFGVHTPETRMSDDLLTRFDQDEFFGTVLNRFIIQAVSKNPITIYGTGWQRTGLMALEDAINSLLFIAKDPPHSGTHRVINHVTEKNLCIREIADQVSTLASQKGITTQISHHYNPRHENEREKTRYDIVSEYLSSRISPRPIQQVVAETFDTIMKYKDRILSHQLIPSMVW